MVCTLIDQRNDVKVSKLCSETTTCTSVCPFLYADVKCHTY